MVYIQSSLSKEADYFLANYKAKHEIISKSVAINVILEKLAKGEMI